LVKAFETELGAQLSEIDQSLARRAANLVLANERP
jgi:hypothetical protein